MTELVLTGLAAYVGWRLVSLGTRDDPSLTAAMPLLSEIPGRTEVRRALRRAAQARGLDPDLLDAIGWVESRWRADAVNRSGPDGAYGGAFGPTQILASTLGSLGYPFPERMSLDDFAAASADYLARGAVVGVRDAAAWWNGGVRSFDDPAVYPAKRERLESYAAKLADAYLAIRAGEVPA